MSVDKRILTAAVALGVAFAVAGCNEEKSSSADKKPTATEAVKDAAKTAADKVEAAADAAKEAAKSAADKVTEKAHEAADAAKEAVAKVEDKVEAMKDGAKEAPAAPPAAEKPAQEAKAPESDNVQPAEAPVASESKTAEADNSSQPDDNPTDPDNAAVRAMAKELGLEWSDGRYRDKDGKPAPVVTKDYKVDWATWQGFRRYHDACHVCHGPNGLGSSFAPALADSLKTMDYETFFGTVVGGRRSNKGGTEFVMPAFGEDKNIMCYLDDIYTYLKARSTGAMPPGRPAGREDISDYARKANDECFNQ